jgi:hypothetical protein
MRAHNKSPTGIEQPPKRSFELDENRDNPKNVLPGTAAAPKSPAVKAAAAASDSAEWVRVQDSNGSQWDREEDYLNRPAILDDFALS